MELLTYKPVVFTAGGEDGVCGGRSFSARPTGKYGLEHFLVVEKRTGLSFHAANLGEIRVGIESLVNGVKWLGLLTVDDVTGEPFGEVMYDACVGGAWGNVNHYTFVALGGCLGTGLGQKYVMTSAGFWIKVEG